MTHIFLKPKEGGGRYGMSMNSSDYSNVMSESIGYPCNCQSAVEDWSMTVIIIFLFHLFNPLIYIMSNCSSNR